MGAEERMETGHRVEDDAETHPRYEPISRRPSIQSSREVRFL